MFSPSSTMRWPKPENDAIVSVPRIARNAKISPIRKPVRTTGNAAGSITFQNICLDDAPIERAAAR